jgi:CheY-like chemotaxis protein
VQWEGSIHLLTTASILVVEDDGILALSSHQLLTKSGYQVPEMFASGEDLLDYLEHSVRPDLILMDIGLDGMIDGIETARRVRNQYDIPVIFVSSYNDDRRIARALEVSPYGFIIKPFVDRKLMECIGTALGSLRPSMQGA